MPSFPLMCDILCACVSEWHLFNFIIEKQQSYLTSHFLPFTSVKLLTTFEDTLLLLIGSAILQYYQLTIKIYRYRAGKRIASAYKDALNHWSQ